MRNGVTGATTKKSHLCPSIKMNISLRKKKSQDSAHDEASIQSTCGYTNRIYLLYQNKLYAVLADEMELANTAQTIAFMVLFTSKLETASFDCFVTIRSKQLEL
ncbi:hypothetical protein AC1031_002723 [Aphanomyces cochlioides]|nr:hypothetical protein AC1031_002723 [Aphanomyces cochlioides]